MDQPQPDAAPYQVLARKYRPRTFADMIGQDALVRTLTNAIRSGRLAHAFVLTGVRGVGKTTTARIIARALNCIGPDGTGGPTVTPCGVCANCTAIAADRHMDVMEMDAASRTGVDDIREILDGVRYAPQQARFKIYIIDEVHMLSKNAFNALLKTLEEPPEHVKFIFATTEIRKVPVTVLSRCQRFDLRRIDAELLSRHFTGLVAAEGAEAEDEAIAMIARAADGSARDGLSILDQAIALATETGASGKPLVTAALVRDMIGLADRSLVIDLFDALAAGAAARALSGLADLHRAGADPVVVLQDLLDFTHFLTRARVVPDVLDNPSVPEAERSRGRDLMQTLSMPVLSRAWQMLLKGLSEVQTAPRPDAALEMVLLRVCYAATQPTPGEILERLEAGRFGGGDPPAVGAGPAGGGSAGGGSAGSSGDAQAGAGAGPEAGLPPSAVALSGPSPRAASHLSPSAGSPSSMPGGSGGGGARLAAQQPTAPDHAAEPLYDPHPAAPPLDEAQPAPMPGPRPEVDRPRSLEAIVALCETRDEPRLAAEIRVFVHLVRLDRGRLEIRLKDGAPRALTGALGQRLSEWLGERWIVTVSQEPGQPTLDEKAKSAEAERMERARAHPTVQALLQAFPGATLSTVTVLDAAPGLEGPEAPNPDLEPGEAGTEDGDDALGSALHDDGSTDAFDDL